jgi:hypothetical protein
MDDVQAGAPVERERSLSAPGGVLVRGRERRRQQRDPQEESDDSAVHCTESNRGLGLSNQGGPKAALEEQ